MRPPYVFCPLDGERLTVIGKTAACPKCKFIDYVNPKPCVAVLVEHEGELVLGRKEFTAGWAWDILGGFIENDETAEEAAQREIAEEAGLELTNLEYLMTARDEYLPGDEPTLTQCFTAKVKTWTPTPGSDIVRIWRFGPAELPNDMAYFHQLAVLEKWRERATRSIDDRTRARLVEEYQQCQRGYEYRDQLTQEEFIKLFQVFSTLFVLLAATGFLSVVPWLLLIIRIVLCVAGTLGLFAILADLEANASCKAALRKIAAENEKKLGYTYWSAIENRSMRREEQIAKKLLGWLERRRRPTSSQYKEGSITDIFVRVGQMLYILWFAASLTAVFMGSEAPFR